VWLEVQTAQRGKDYKCRPDQKSLGWSAFFYASGLDRPEYAVSGRTTTRGVTFISVIKARRSKRLVDCRGENC
jgi:hypothetical protein